MSDTTSIDLATCIKSATNFGETVYTNVCSGAVTTVPWGTMDYIGTIGIGSLFAVMGFMVLGLIVAIIRD